MFQQHIGDPAVGGHHDNPVVKFRAFAVRDQNIIEHVREFGHGRAPDFFYGMVSHFSLCFLFWDLSA
jgi:hypothetical protein